MPSLADKPGTELDETAQVENSAQDDASHPICSPSAGPLGFDSSVNHGASASMHDTVESQGGIEAERSINGSPDLTSATVPPDHDRSESDQDLGVFDDSHLQVDQPKKKKKKKSRKPKSKRGLVTCRLLPSTSTD